MDFDLYKTRSVLCIRCSEPVATPLDVMCAEVAHLHSYESSVWINKAWVTVLIPGTGFVLHRCTNGSIPKTAYDAPYVCTGSANDPEGCSDSRDNGLVVPWVDADPGVRSRGFGVIDRSGKDVNEIDLMVRCGC